MGERTTYRVFLNGIELAEARIYQRDADRLRSRGYTLIPAHQ